MYDPSCPTVSGSGSSKQPPVLDRLREQKKEFEKRLSDLENAINVLEQNPAVNVVLEALNRLGHY